MEMNYKVYVHINKANGKRYYGITKKKVERRWENGKGYKFYIDKKGRRQGNEHFWRSICKYGWDNFEHIVIARGLTEEEAKWLEIELIREHDTTNREYGYNISLGGEGNNGHKHTEESKKKMSESAKGRTLNEEARKKLSKNNAKYWKGKTRSEETIKKMSESLKGRTSPMKGRTLSEEARKKLSKNNKERWKNEEYRKKMSEAFKGKGGKQIYCVELDKYFDTVTEAGKYIGCDDSSISQVAKGKRYTAGGYHWLYANEVNEENINKVMSQEKNILKGKNSPSAKQVYCVELNMYFDTITEASEYVGCSISSISMVLNPNKSNKTAKGMHWVYAEDVEKLDIENNKVS